MTPEYKEWSKLIDKVFAEEPPDDCGCPADWRQWRMKVAAYYWWERTTAKQARPDQNRSGGAGGGGRNFYG